jgi:phosphopantetheinyl transferase
MNGSALIITGGWLLRLYYAISETPQPRELARYLLKQATDGRPGVIAYGEHGKPYFKDSDIYFNYSHCKYGAACIVANQEIGVDIQELRTVKPSVIKRVCCDNEIKLIKTDEDFIKIWTMKEAYAKFTGKGFAEGFKSIDTTTFPEKCSYRVGNMLISWYCENPTDAELQLVEVSPP